MIIAVDATSIPQPMAGAGVYIYNLIKQLALEGNATDYVFFASSKTVNALRHEKCRAKLIPVDINKASMRLVWEQVVLPRLLQENNVDLLHSPHYTMPLAAHTKRVVTYHDLTFFILPQVHQPIKTAFFRIMMTLTKKNADHIITDSESTRQDAIRLLGIDPSKISSVLLAANSVFKPIENEVASSRLQKYGLNVNRYICYVGVIEPRKNVDLLIEAYARIADQFQDIPLVIVGKQGWQYNRVFRKVNDLGLNDRVRFLGHICMDDLVAIYSGASVFVYPSQYEGFGLPVLEAMQCGAPVITTNVSSMPEVSGGAAILIDPDNIDALSTAMADVLKNATLASRLSNSGLERAKSFSWSKTARETIHIYESVLKAVNVEV